jgi:ppGpp synthetase/RelA/SpoT-type nucleotidyltranferase
MTDFVEQYKRMREGYEELTKEVSRIVTDLAAQSSPVVLSHITSRTKDPDGVKEKIERKRYTNPSDQMEDLAGVRAIVYRSMDITELDGRISRTFDLAGGDDVSARLGDKFMGYGGVHLVVRLKEGMVPGRDHLLGLKCEVQIRTVLQDAWSVISHPLAYKSEVDLPVPLRRRFNTLSALLEIVDESFEDIIETRERIVKELKQTPELLHKSGINVDSLTAFCEKRFPNLKVNPHWMSFIIENVHAGTTIKTIGDIADALDRTTTLIEAYRSQRPDLFKYSTDFVTKALGWTDQDFRHRHPFSETTRRQFADHPLPDA